VQSEKGGNWGDIYCTSRCKYEEVLCGNGTIDTDIPGGTPDEECDPGAAHLGEGSAQCREWCYLPLCGDGIVDNSNNQTNGYQTLDGFEEECDNGSKCVGIRSPDGEIYEGMDCYHIWLKGGSIDKVSNYACEAYGGTCEPQSGDGCDDQCKNEGQSHSSASNVLSANSSSDGGGGGESCGNGIREGSEICDEGINNSDDTEATCRTDCTPGTCGNGQIETGHGEECDCGPIDTTNCITVNSEGIGILCRLSCTGDYCGDGDLYSKGIDNQYRTMDDEVCDLGEQNSDDPNAQCRTDCKPKRCGDGIVDSGEECDIGEMRCDDGSLCAVLDDDVTRWKDTCIWNPLVPSNQGSCSPAENDECDSNCNNKDGSKSSSDTSNPDGGSSISSNTSNSDISTISSSGNKDSSSGDESSGGFVSSRTGSDYPRYTRCKNNSCVEILGNGYSLCLTDNKCINEVPICRNGVLEGIEECETAIGCFDSSQDCDVTDCTCHNVIAIRSSYASSYSYSYSSLYSSSSVISVFLSKTSERSSNGNILTKLFNNSEEDTLIAAINNCGNGTLETPEECDDGNRRDEDGCNSTCHEENLVASASVCGNGLLETSEECDDQNRRDNDGCNSTCLLEIGICGDGIVQTLLGEQCENSTHDIVLPYQCSKCRFLSQTCGDREIDPGEECDDGKLNSNSPNANCRPGCAVSRCGDSILDDIETCDDGNRLNNDGCDRYCRIEHEYEDDEYEQETQVANTLPYSQLPTPYSRNVNFPQYPSYQQMPYQLPMAQLQPLIQAQGPIGDTGPAAVAVIGAGAAAGLSWIRRKRK
jgi:cysteine-rich repeat protein